MMPLINKLNKTWSQYFEMVIVADERHIDCLTAVLILYLQNQIVPRVSHQEYKFSDIAGTIIYS